MISNKSTSTRQQCKWISSLNCFKWHLDSSISSRIHKWCIDQLTSDILQVVLMIIANVQEIVFIDKSIIYVVSHIYTWYQPYKKVVPQVILNFKWSSNEEYIPHYKSSSLSNGWPMQWFRGRCSTNWYQGQRSYVWYLKSYTSGVIPIIKWCP